MKLKRFLVKTAFGVTVMVSCAFGGAYYESQHAIFPWDYEWVAEDTDLTLCDSLLYKVEPRLDPSIRKLYAYHINYYTKAFGVPVRLAIPVFHYESHWNPLALSKKGARGLGQRMPATHKDQLEKNGNSEDEAYYVEVQIRDTCEDLAGLLKKFRDPRLAVAAYNCGRNRESLKQGKIPKIKETQDYTKDVMFMYAMLTYEDSITIASK